MKRDAYIKRTLRLNERLATKSQFLLGPRMTGKTTYIRNELQDRVSLSWNLLDGRLRMRVLSDPGILKEEIEARDLHDCLVVIDEIQKAPLLLEEVQFLIEERNIRFLLIGSSARKLRSGGVNLLGGRAGHITMHPLVFPEIQDTNYTLERIFQSGLLPSAFCSEHPDEELNDYVALYLNEEIQAEGVTRKLPQFSRFLEVAALSNTQMLNFTNIASDVGVSRQAVTGWYQVLVDTLIGYELPSFTNGKKRKTYGMPKFYFFDLGVARALQNVPVPTSIQTEYGAFFEHYVFMELRSYLDYIQSKEVLSYWRTTSNFEVDFVLGENVAIETKTTKKADSKDYRGLKAFMEEGICDRYILVCCEERPRKLENGIEVMPWKYFLQLLWDGKIV
ncbi:ATP-binding protein [Sphaerochaeta halotolerans]|uniref:ATP-binding protein n=1 Tax=Sphaerochaeta halotolerans TaxID=2293840 RepID=A0A372MDL1_9SPIR|nr:AAA family ATPase [Sphaerochaeta halotolerans]RFU93885.1 ATP-binding protein [Sphaerochaeta halotolerans]